MLLELFKAHSYQNIKLMFFKENLDIKYPNNDQIQLSILSTP